MRLIMLATAAVFLAAPALAQTPAPPSDTVKAILEKGISVDFQGTPGDIDYKADGTFSGFGGMFAGTYKADGSKICMTVPGMFENQCTTYPDGKKSGDSFEVTGQQGPMMMKIK